MTILMRAENLETFAMLNFVRDMAFTDPDEILNWEFSREEYMREAALTHGPDGYVLTLDEINEIRGALKYRT